MKKLILSSIILFALFSFKNDVSSFNNSPSKIDTFPTHVVGSGGILEVDRGPSMSLVGTIPTRYSDTTQANTSQLKNYPGAEIIVGNTKYNRDSTANRWIANGSGTGDANIIPGGPITSNDIIGFNPGTSIPTDSFIIKTFYQSQVPTASLTGGIALELQSSATLNYTLNYSAGRQGATQPLNTITVAGNNESFSQPSAPGAITGTQSVSFPANTNITYSNIVTTTDGKSATATTTFSFLPKRYWGLINVSDTSGIGTYGWDDSKITSLNSELSYSDSKSWNTGTPTGTQIIVYAYYYTAGNLSHMDLNGFPSIDAFNSVQRNFNNAAGYTGQWIIYWSRNGQTLSSDIIAY